MYPEVTLLGATLRSYELCLAAAVLGCNLLGPVWASRLERIAPRRVSVTLVIVGIAAFAGAHVHYALRHWAPFREQPLRLLEVWRGLHAAGALAAIVVAIPIAARLASVRIGVLADGLAPTIALGTVIARIGCLLNGCCRGSACTASWCIVYPGGRLSVHPLPLYFAVLGIATMLVALAARSKRQYAGEAALRAGVLFAVGMTLLETWRDATPMRSYWLGVPQHVWLGGGLAAVLGILLLGARGKQAPSSGEGGRRICLHRGHSEQ